MTRVKTKNWRNRFTGFFFKTWKGRIIFFLVVALVIFRLFLPMIVKNYVNKVLANIPGYHGWVDDIDIALIRGAYVINGLHLYKDGNKKPMLDFPKSDISIQWRALFHGRIVSEIEMASPKFNLYTTANKLPANTKPGKDDWTAALKKLIPIKINRLVVEDGEFLYADVVESPDINLSVKKIQLKATNLGNVEDKSLALPSQVNATAISFGNGSVVLNGKMNLLKEIPDMDVNLSLKNSNATALNSLTLAVAGFDFEKGTFELFTEFTIKKGYLKGYVKPMFEHIVIPDSFRKSNSTLGKRIWEGVVNFFGFVLKNKPKNSFATKIPVEGNLNDPNIKLWTLIKNVLRHGFIQPFKAEVDNEINFRNAGKK